MKKHFRFLLLIVLVAAGIYAGRGLFKYDIYYTQDFKHHLLRSYDAVYTLGEGALPMRWAGILNYECGVPMYNFYNPLLYYLAAVIFFATNHLILSLKIINLLCLVLGPLFFYLWILKETGSKLSAFASGFTYLFAPYTLLLVYVRGSPEYLAYAIAPLVFYFYSAAFSKKKKSSFVVNLFFASVAGGLLALSHNVVFLLVFPVIFVYLLAKIYSNRGINIKLILISFISILGFSAFFVFPAVLEKGYTQLDTPIFNYADHFPTLAQVINSKWGYGDSAIGTDDDAMSFQLGYVQWLALGLIAVYILIKVKNKQVSRSIFAIVFWVIAIVSLYFVLPWSLPIWRKISLLQEIQFSWRILGICVFAISAAVGFWLSKLKIVSRILFFTIICLLAFVGNRNHLLAQPVLENDLPFYRELDQISGKRRYFTANATTVLPPGAALSCYTTTLVVSSDLGEEIDFLEVYRGSSYGKLDVDIDKSKIMSDKIVINLGYFPGMFDLKLNGKNYAYGECGGLTCLSKSDMDDRENTIVWKVVGTPVERFFNLITIVFFIVWGYIILKAVVKK